MNKTNKINNQVVDTGHHKSNMTSHCQRNNLVGSKLLQSKQQTMEIYQNEATISWQR
jgi:hypothetical protein